MKISPETLMAYADGELDADTRAAVAQAVAVDPALAAQVAAQQTLRQRLQHAFAAELDEPVPQRLRDALQPPAGTQVVDLAARRAAQAAAAPAPAAAPMPAAWGWRAWGGLAAGLMVGLLLGRLGGPGLADQPTEGASPASAAVMASGALAQALGDQLASAPAGGAVAVRLSFVDRDGRYCRAFELTGQAGLACRTGEGWAVQALVARVDPAGGDAGGLRQAASPLPPALLAEIDSRIAGDPLGAGAEQQARSQGWRH